ncbi:DUF58 domain-containing protein [Paenibacillus sp. CN-4]|uniref:DUF58 domain-containing protein n=1 Tax=Paenibacillus nanchangensis TaxID=3348343 RepID=UPI00397DD7ED
MRRLYNAASSVIQPGKLAGILAVWAVTLLYVLFQGGKTSFMLFSMVSLLTLYLIFGGFGGIRRAKGSRKLYGDHGGKTDLLHAGGHLRVKLNISIPGFLPLPYIIVREMLKRHNGESWVFEESFVPNLRGTGELRFQTPSLERGTYTFSNTEIVSEDIFGLVEHKGSFEAEGKFRVLPRVVYIPRWTLYERNSRLAGHQTSLAHSRRETTQINGVRDYVYGDRMTRIHWNATAKTGTWKSKEFEHESIPKTMIVLDCTATAYSTTQQFELAVSAAASLLGFGVRDRIEIGLCVLDRNVKVFVPSENGSERQMMIQYLVDVEADGRGSMVTRLERGQSLFPKGSYMVLVSPQAGGPAFEVLRWAENRGLTPCHVHIMSPAGFRRREEWENMLKSRGASGYSVGALSELPAALGGEGVR